MPPNNENATVKPTLKTFINLDTYLRSHTAVKGEGHTHTRIGDKNNGIFGGSYNINDDEWKDFMKSYYYNTFINGKKEYLTEKQLEENGPILLDFDFRFPAEIVSRQHSKNHIIDVVMLYADKILELVDIPINQKIEVFAMEKKDVNVLENKTKDGIHIIFGLAMHKSLQILLRDKVLPDIKNLWDDLPLINDWDSVVDEGVVKGISNWQVYGSRKPANQAYQMKYHFEISTNDYDAWDIKELSMDTFSVENNILKLSARYSEYPSFPMKEEVTADFEKAKKTLHQVGKKTPKPTATATALPPPTTGVENNELIEVLNMIDKKYIYKGNHHHLDRVKIVLATKKEFNDKAKDIIFTLCKDDPNFDEDGMLKLLEQEVRNVSAGTLYHYAKLSNPYAYELLLIKYKKYLKLSILNKGENDIAKYIADYLCNKAVFCNNRWWVFDTKLKIWRIGTPVAVIISEMQRQIDIAKKSLITVVIDEEDEEKKKKYIKMQKDYDNFRTAVGKSGFANQVITCLKEYSLDIYFEEKLDVSPYKVAYKNGLLDLKTLSFKPVIEAEDYLTSFIPYDYEVGKEEDIVWVRNEIFKICNCNMEHFNYYLSFLGYAMTGDSSRMQAFFNILGQKASNGKSIIFETLMKIIPNYITEGENDLFECNFGSRHKEIATWRGIRIMWINELTKKKQDAEVIKKISDGTSIKYKVMFGINGTMPITFKMAVISNNTLKIDGDAGIERRLKTMQMNSEFEDKYTEDDFENKHFKKDEGFGEKLQTKYKHALMSLIYQYSKSFVDDGFKMKPIPKDWEEESKNIVASNNKFQEFFDKYFIADSEGKASKKRIEEIMTECNIHANIKDELMKMKLAVKYNSQGKCKGSGSVKGVWEGIREKTDEEKAADEEE